MKRLHVLILAGVFLDQISKYYVRISEYSVIKVTSFLNIVHVWNTGVAWGFLGGYSMRLTLIFVPCALCLLLILWLLRVRYDSERVAISLILSGALGNIIDRIRFGAVFDFLDLHWHNIHFPAFNISDILITIGFIVMMKEALMCRK